MKASNLAAASPYSDCALAGHRRKVLKELL
jgi:hypothetical protein